jgi:hypothetical protein
VDPTQYLSVLSFGLELGLDLGIGLLYGSQKTGLVTDLATLSVINKATKTAVVVLGVTADLEVTLTYPQKGAAPTTLLAQNTTTMTIGMPAYVSGSVDTMSVTVTPPTKWTVQDPSQGSLNLMYIGEDSAAWDENIVISISGVKNNSSAQVQAAALTVVMKGAEGTGTLPPHPRPHVASLPLVQQTFSASLSWNVNHESDFTVTGDSSGTCTADSPPDIFSPLISTDGTAVTVTDNEGRVWKLGYVFGQTGASPYIQAFWWKDGKPFSPRNYYASEKVIVKATAATTTANYRDVSGSPNNLQITATLT